MHDRNAPAKIAPLTNANLKLYNPNPNPSPYTALNQEPNDNPLSYSRAILITKNCDMKTPDISHCVSSLLRTLAMLEKS